MTVMVTVSSEFSLKILFLVLILVILMLLVAFCSKNLFMLLHALAIFYMLLPGSRLVE